MDANDSELTPDLEFAINQIEADLETKADSVMVLVQEAEHEAEAARLESNRLRSRAQACDYRAASLKKYLIDTLTAMGRHRIITPRFKGTIQLAQESIRWTFASDPPETNRTRAISGATTSITRSLATAAIGSALPQRRAARQGRRARSSAVPASLPPAAHAGRNGERRVVARCDPWSDRWVGNPWTCPGCVDTWVSVPSVSCRHSCSNARFAPVNRCARS